MKHSPNPHLLCNGRMSRFGIKNKLSICSGCERRLVLDALTTYFYLRRYLGFFFLFCASKFRISIESSYRQDCFTPLYKDMAACHLEFHCQSTHLSTTQGCREATWHQQLAMLVGATNESRGGEGFVSRL